MSEISSWFGRAAAAARTAGERTDQWPPGSLGTLTYLAWLPLLLTVAALPRTSDLAFVGARLFSSGAFPWNVFLLAALATIAVLVACLLGALAEAALLRGAGRGTPRRSLTRETEVAFSVLLVAVLPTIAALAVLALGVAAVAPAEFGAPDIGGPLLARIAGHLVPLIVVVAILVVVGQAFGAAALRRAIGPDAMPVGASLRVAWSDLAGHPIRRIGLALASTLSDLLAAILAYAVLRVIWAPIAVELDAGRLASPRALLLLVGFVAIWLALVLALGVLRAWVSAWWSVELTGTDEAGRAQVQEANP